MSSALSAKSQVPPFKYWKPTGSFSLLDASGSVPNTGVVAVGTSNVLRDMGKKVYLPGAASTLVKVQVIPYPAAGGTEANGYKTGYISLGDGSLAASAVALLN